MSTQGDEFGQAANPGPDGAGGGASGDSSGGGGVSGEPSLTMSDSKRAALRDLLVIAAPSVATMTSYTVMQFIDSWMVKSIGPEPIYLAAAGNGGILAWVAMSFLLGVAGVLNGFVSQNLGAGKPRSGVAYTYNALYLGVAYYALIMLPLVLLAPSIFESLQMGVGDGGGEGAGVGGADGGGEQAAALMALQTGYAQVLLGGSVLVLLSRTLSNFFYGMHRPNVVLVAAVLGNCVNIFMNWVLIFGNLGAPALGVLGAAIATVIGTGVEFAIPLALFWSGRFHREFATRTGWRLDRRRLMELLKVGWPAGLMFANEMICWAYLMSGLVPEAGYAAAIAGGGTEAQAAHESVLSNTAGWIALRYMHLSFMPAVGISIAATALVGKALGAGRADIARSRVRLALALTVAYMGLWALAFVFFREQLIGVFVNEATPPEDRARLIAIGGGVMIAAAVFQMFDAVAIVLTGALRGAGDTVFPGVATIVCSWLCIPALGHLLIWLAPGLGALGPWIGASAYIIVLGVLLTLRYLSGVWATGKLVDRDDEQPTDRLGVAEAAPGMA